MQQKILCFKDFMKIFHDLHEAGHTIIFVTHEEGVAEEANRIIKILDGNIISDLKK